MINNEKYKKSIAKMRIFIVLVKHYFIEIYYYYFRKNIVEEF